VAYLQGLNISELHPRMHAQKAAKGGAVPLSDEEIDRMIKVREQARSTLDYKTADKIRETLEKNGVHVDDKGKKWQTADGRSGPIGPVNNLIIERAWYGGPHNHSGQVHHGSSLEHGWLWQTGDRKGKDVTKFLRSSVCNGELNFNSERRGCNDLFGFGHEWQCHKILVVQYKYGKSGQVQTWFSESVGGEPYHCLLPASPPPSDKSAAEKAVAAKKAADEKTASDKAAAKAAAMKKAAAAMKKAAAEKAAEIKAAAAKAPLEAQLAAAIVSEHPVARVKRWGDGLEAPAAGSRHFVPQGFKLKLEVPEAIERFGHSKSHVREIMDAGRAKASTSPTPLASSHAAALFAYTEETPLYVTLNYTMRTPHTPSTPTDTELKHYADYIVHMEAALSSLPTHVSEMQGKVYRGIKVLLNHDIYAPGKQITWQGFSSSTKKQTATLDFLTMLPGRKLQGSLFVIDSITAKDIRHFSAIPSEEEVLFPPNSQFKVAKVVRNEPEKKALLNQLSAYDTTDLDVYVLKQMA
jgi:hypothetical protein